MPRIIKKEDIQGHPQIPGFQIKSVTETLNQDSKVMEVKRLILDPNIISPEFTHNDIDQLLYVIKGDGIAKVNSKEFPLDKESILWLESGEKYHFISGGLGLEILQAIAPFTHRPFCDPSGRRDQVIFRDAQQFKRCRCATLRAP